MNEIQIIPSKELVLNKAGATRERGAKVISEAMTATKMTLDKFGEEHIEPDHTIRLRAEELRAKYTGDIKPDGAITNIQTTISLDGNAVAGLLNLVADVKSQLANLKIDGKQTGEIIDVGDS